MKICVYGLGAIGSLLAARLSATDHELICIARGATLSVIEEQGLSFTSAGETRRIDLNCTDDPATAGIQDVVFLTLKAYSLPAIAESLEPLLGPDTVVVTLCNGLPWWYHHGRSETANPEPVKAVDPAGDVWRCVGAEKALGCVVYPAARVDAPGVVSHISGDKFSLGEPDGSSSDRIFAVADVLRKAGFEVSVSDDLRAEIWFKLMANAAYNPLSLLTGKTLGDMFDDPATYQLIIDVMAEVSLVAESEGYKLALTPEQLVDATRPFAAHKTSMLLDFEAVKRVELDALVGAVQEVAQNNGVFIPALDTLQALAASKASAAGCYP